MTTKAKKQKNPVLVTTEHRGLFQGDLKEYDLETRRAVITQARCAIAWRNIKGFPQLAATGPTKDCRISPAAPEMTLEKVTAIVKCTAEAVAAWELEPWG